MKVSRENIKTVWAEASGFNFCKLLEDNQRLSLPMLTRIASQPVIMAFVYSCNMGKMTVSQRHFWDMNGRHQMMLCKKIYPLESVVTVDKDEYMEKLCSAAGMLFEQSLSQEEKDIFLEYARSFGNGNLNKIYLTENEPLLKWAKAQELL